jgi:ribosome modulation factor
MHGGRCTMRLGVALLLMIVVYALHNRAAIANAPRSGPNCEKGQCLTYSHGYQAGIEFSHSCDYPAPDGTYSSEWLSGYHAGLSNEPAGGQICG